MTASTVNSSLPTYQDPFPFILGTGIGVQSVFLMRNLREKDGFREESNRYGAVSFPYQLMDSHGSVGFQPN